MAAQICETCKHKHEGCYCSPNSTCSDYEREAKTPFNKKYNIEWYLDNSEVQTTSATLMYVKDGYMVFEYPMGGLLILKGKLIRSMCCLED